MMLKICRELPDMYIMMAFMGSCLAGANATSQAFLSFNVSVSSLDGRVRGGVRFWAAAAAAARYHVTRKISLELDSILFPYESSACLA